MENSLNVPVPISEKPYYITQTASKLEGILSSYEKINSMSLDDLPFSDLAEFLKQKEASLIANKKEMKYRIQHLEMEFEYQKQRAENELEEFNEKYI